MGSQEEVSLTVPQLPFFGNLSTFAVIGMRFPYFSGAAAVATVLVTYFWEDVTFTTALAAQQLFGL